MKVNVVSDIHLEFWGGGEEKHLKSIGINKDLPLILAGDICTFREPSGTNRWEAETVFSYLCEQSPLVLYVPGNHEYYKAESIQRVEDRLQEIELQNDNFKVLRPREVVLHEGRRFLGGTMWFPNTPGVNIGAPYINDTYLIKDIFPWAFNQNTALREWLSKECKEDDVVVTHHLPTRECQPERFKDNIISPYFVSDMSDIIEKNNPATWIFGHTHDPKDFVVGKTRLLCNPIGYPNEIYKNNVYPSLEFEI